MGEFENAIQRLRDEGHDLADVFDQFKATELRKKAGRTDELERENEKLREKLDDVETLPKKLEALQALNVDLEALRPAERREIERVKVDKVDEAWAETFIEENKLPVGSTREAPEETGAFQVVQQARQAPTGGASKSGAINEETVKTWSMQDKQTFRQKHPEAWDAIKDGGEITGISFP